MKRKIRKRRSTELETIDLRTILDSMVEAVFVVDDSGRIVLTNRALDELLDRDARGSRPKKLIRSDALRLAVRRARKERVATEVEIEGVIEAASGERTLTFQAQVSPLPGLAGVVPFTFACHRCGQHLGAGGGSKAVASLWIPA